MASVLTLVLIMLFIISRYHKFRTNEFVIHLRNGKVRSAGLGGKIIKLPLVDEIIVIPTTTRKTMLNASEKVLSREYQDLKIVAMLYWRVSDPSQAFSAVVWDPRSDDYVEEVLKTITEAIIRTTCASLEIEVIIRERTEIIKRISDQLHIITKDWGITIESLEIIEVTVIDQELKKNMEAVKKIAEEQKARMAMANSKEVYKLRELEVEKKIGVAEQKTKLEITTNRKNLEIKEQEMEKQRRLIQAEMDKVSTIKAAEAEAERIKMSKLATVKAEAEGIKVKLNAEAEGTKTKMMAEAEGTRAKMLAEAEGLKKQIESINQADEKTLMVKLLEAMPEISKNIKPEKMLVMGEGNEAFASLAKMILPFVEIFPQFSDVLKRIDKKSNKQGNK